MGILHIGEKHSYRFEDETLAHLRTVITSKLLLQESFMFTWVEGGSQRSVWLNPASTLLYEFESSATPELNRAWLETLLSRANSSAGLRLTERPGSRMNAL